MKVLKKHWGVFLVIFLIFLNLSFFIVGYISYLYPKLGNFQIENVIETDRFLTVNVTPSLNATKYEVTVKKEKEVIYETASEDTNIPLENLEANYNDSLDIEVKAINKNNEEKASDNRVEYVYYDASFRKEENYFYSNNQDVVLNLEGYDPNEDYSVAVFYGKKNVFQALHVTSSIIIPKENLKGYSGRLTAILYNKNKRKINSMNFYVNTPVVGKINITSPTNDFKTRWNDITLKFNGGENATHYYVNFYVNNNLVKTEEVFPINNQVLLEAAWFMENTDYKIVFEAVYEDYFEIAEKKEIYVSVGEKETTSPVVVSHNPNFIKEGTRVSLSSRTSDAIIYYTTDGSVPNANSLVYQEPLIITNDMTVKTYAVSSNRYDSAMNEYNFKIMDKTPVIYLSPSNQFGNYGVKTVGYTTEEEMMNKLADVIERHLKNAGFIVYRNNPYGDINAWNAVSNRVGADFHLAIHSNASKDHTARGIEIHVDDETSPSLSAATFVYNNLWSIYPGNTNPTYNRGVKYARGSLGEANDDYVRNGALIEVAFHDEYNDALWIVENMEQIGQNIASSIISYYN